MTIAVTVTPYTQGHKVPRVYVNTEGFKYIEEQQERGVTVPQFAAQFGISKRSAATWLSKWKAARYMKHRRGVGHIAGTYYIDNSCIWWGVKVFDTARSERSGLG